MLVVAMRGFADEAEQRSPEEVVGLMDQLIGEFDDAARRHGVEKVKTAGETFVAAAGLTVPRLDHAQRALACAEDIVRIVERFNRRRGTAIDVRIGMDSGTVIIGVVGKDKFAFDLWGRTASVAQRILLDGDHNTIRIAQGAFERFTDTSRFAPSPPVQSKALGELANWELNGEAAPSAPAEAASHA